MNFLIFFGNRDERNTIKFVFGGLIIYTWGVFVSPLLMYKVFIPHNISGGWFDMGVQIGPFSISLLQLVILAVGLGLSGGVGKTLNQNGVGNFATFLVAIPLFLVFVFIAFFKYSELTLIPFIAKMIRTYFLDVTKKFQINRLRPDPHAINLARFRNTDHEVIIEHKELQIDQEKMKKLRRFTRKNGVMR